MTRKFLGFIFVVAVTLLFGINVKADSLQVTRLGGYDRYQTNTDIINQMWEKSEYIVIVSGENFPDALSATVLAKKYDAPILLTYLDFYGEQEEQLDKLGVKKAFIIGGTGVVSKSIEDTLSRKGIEYERIYGNDRYETSVAVANKIGAENGIMVTTGSDYSDALSVSPIAAKLQMPIILSQKDGLEYAQNKFISENTIPKTYVLGTKDAINDITAYTFPNAKRIAMGNSKYDRNLDIINTFSGYIDFTKVILASGADFPDALSGTALAALKGNPIILTGEYSYSGGKESANDNFIETLIGNEGTQNIYALGLEGSISEDNLNSIVNSSKALNIVKSNITLSADLRFGNMGMYSYNGSDYYRIALYAYNEAANAWLIGNYKYDFLVDTKTLEIYKIYNDSDDITPLDGDSIKSVNDGVPIFNGMLNIPVFNGILNIEQALDLVNSQIELEANESIHIPFEESRWVTTYNGDKCYCIVKDYNETGDPSDRTELCEYLVNISTGQVIQCIQGQYTPIN